MTKEKAKVKVGKSKRTNRKPTSKPRYIAVVMRADTNFSKRCPHKDWSCFVDEKKAEAVKRALKASREWGAIYGDYDIFVGRLTEAVSVPVEFRFEKL